MATAPNRKQRLSKLQEKALRRLQENRDRNRMFVELENMEMNRYELPNSIRKLTWIHKTISSDPQDALRAATQVLSTVRPRIKYTPLLDGEANENVATNIERNLEWQWNLAEKRHKFGLLQDIVGSALKYGVVAAQTNYLPHQIEAMGAFRGKDAGRAAHEKRRLQFAQRYGKFAISVRNPKDVYARQSDYMLEDVMYIRLWDAKRFLDYFGQSVPRKLATEILDNKHRDMAVYEYIDYDQHSIWATPLGGPSDLRAPRAQRRSNIAIETVQNVRPSFLMETKNTLGFIPWTVESRGTSLMDFPEEQLRPLLYGVLSSQHWQTQNMILTLLTSEAIVHAAQARRRVKGPNPDAGFQRDFAEPGGIEKVDTIHEVESLPPDPIDDGLLRIADTLGAMIGKETVSKFLQNPEATADVPFSSLNLIFQLGANSLEPFKNLAQNALEGIYRNMLYYTDKFVTKEKPLVAHSTDGDIGKQMILHKGMFDVENINLEVKLSSDVPSDIMQKTNWAIAQNQNLQVPLEKLHENFGYTDSQLLRKRWQEEQLDNHFITLSTQADQIQQQIEAQNAQIEAQQQAQQQQAPSGQDPAAGGSPPVQGGAPIREQATGQTRGGSET